MMDSTVKTTYDFATGNTLLTTTGLFRPENTPIEEQKELRAQLVSDLLAEAALFFDIDDRNPVAEKDIVWERRETNGGALITITAQVELEDL